ncbi:MAG TPA: hypothetical protein VJA18_04995 [Candidatus Nanoarchaeia archaeon]|nr:hypothetical protein [Candidatus Nanoarchaeia archaeon]
MKLTIDTQVDTHDDIRKVLQVLTSILEKKDSQVSVANTDTTNLMSMFGDQKGTVETKGNAPDFGSFLNLTSQKKENKDDESGIEYY